MQAVEALAKEFAPDLVLKALKDSLVLEDEIVLMPGTDYRDGRIWMTAPAKIPTERKVGKGKDATTEIYNRQTTVIIRSDGQAWEYTPEIINALGFTYPLIYYHTGGPEATRWATRDMHDFIDNANGPPGYDVFTILKNYYLEYIEFPEPIYYDLMPLWVMASYVYRIFNAISYIHFNGSAASGKSQNLKLLKAFGLNPTMTSNTSISALFRKTAAHPGILCLDEAERYESEDGKQLLQMLKAGYLRGNTVIRSERPAPDLPYQPMEFPVYSPKAIASIAPQDNVLTTRTIVVPMASALRRIPEFNEENHEWQLVRNKLYRWALFYGPDVATALKDWSTNKRHSETPNLRNRHWQLAQSFFAITEAIGLGSLHKPLLEFFTNYFSQMQAQISDSDRVSIVMRTLPTVLRTRQPGYGSDYYSLKDIHELLLTHVEADEEDYWKSRHVSRNLRAAGFKDTKLTQGGLHFRLDPAIVQDRLTRRELEPFEGDEDWLRQVTTEKPLRDLTLDWLDQYSEEGTATD